MRNSNLFKHRNGFTFIELMMTLAIMGVLLLVTVPMGQIVVQRHKEKELRNALIQIREALDSYKRASEQGRIRQKIGDSGYPKSLSELVDGVLDQRSPVQEKLFFLRRLPADPFSSTSEGGDPSFTWGLRSYASPPDDPVEGADVFDIYSKSKKIGLNGVAYQKW